MVFELPESFGQDGCADSRQAVEQISEPLWPGEEFTKQQLRPPLTDHVERQCQRAELVVPTAVLGGRWRGLAYFAFRSQSFVT